MHEDRNEGRAFRWAIGLVVMVTAIGGFGALFYFKIPPENKDAFVFALGSVFGWASSVVASEYGSTTTGRKVADSAIRGLERQNVANEGPAGTHDDPIQTKVVNTEDEPANVRDQTG
jgi:hypothetical protein